MKKPSEIYICPEVQIMEMNSEAVLCTSSGQTEDIFTSEGEW